MKDIGEVIRAKQSQRDRLAREIDTLQQALMILDQEDRPSVPVTQGTNTGTGTDTPLKRWP